MRDALAAIDASKGSAAMAAGGEVKFRADGQNIYAHPWVQWRKPIFQRIPQGDAHTPSMKASGSPHRCLSHRSGDRQWPTVGGILRAGEHRRDAQYGVVKIVNSVGRVRDHRNVHQLFAVGQVGICPLISLAISMPALFFIGLCLQHFLIRHVLGLRRYAPIFSPLRFRYCRSISHCFRSRQATGPCVPGTPTQLFRSVRSICHSKAYRLRAGHTAERRVATCFFRRPTSAKRFALPRKIPKSQY